jgi:non-specific serine/threonine protein kinase
MLGMTMIYRAAHVEAIERVQRGIDQYPIESRRRNVIRFARDMPAIAASQIPVSLLSRGLLDTAARSAVRAIERARGINHPAELCIALAYSAAYIFLSLGQLEVAERYGDELISHASMHGHRPHHAAGLCVRGGLAIARDDPGGGLDLLRHGLAGIQEASYNEFYPFSMVELATAPGGLGRTDDGLAEIETALRFAGDTGHRWFVPETFRVKGELITLRDPNDPGIEDCFNRGVEVAREQDALFWELRLALSLARSRATRGRRDEARRLLAPVYDRFTEGFDTISLRTAKAMLEALRS